MKAQHPVSICIFVNLKKIKNKIYLNDYIKQFNFILLTNTQLEESWWCEPPQVSIWATSNLIQRSKMIRLSTSLVFALCNISSHTIKYNWFAHRIEFSQLIDLSLNPTSSSSELVIHPNTLAYGVYNFVVQVDLSSELYGNLSTTADRQIEVIPTGVVVIAIANSVSSQLIGSNQSFTFNPAAYSYDPDEIVAPSSLTFDFYCTILNVNAASSYSVSSDQSLKSYNSISTQWNQTCFRAICK